MESEDIPATESSGSLAGLSISDDDIGDDDALNGDTWIEELECALLADCDPATLKKICEGKMIPDTLRADYWRILLALNDADGRVKLTNEYDLANQNELRQDCEMLVEDISRDVAPEPLDDAERLKLMSAFESTLTTYVKARPELNYVSGNGWTDILKVLYNLQLSDTQLYQMFFRIVDRYIPRDLSQSPTIIQSDAEPKQSKSSPNKTKSNSSDRQKSEISSKSQSEKQQLPTTKQRFVEKSVQAYHLLRLLIQYHDPELCSILDSRKVTSNLYVKDWFCSLFARSCPTKLALQIWDAHFKMADPFLIFFAAIVMVVNASDELKKGNLNKMEMLNILKKMPSQLKEDDIDDLYCLVSNHYTNTTPRSIRSYSHLFFMDTFGATYSGNESPDDGGSTLVDLKTCRLTSSLDLSQYLCLPIVPAEIFSQETAQKRFSHTGSASSSSTLRYFLVDCRPAEQYNAGHLNKAFHLDCSLMLREPSSFATAVQALLEIQRQVVASKSNTGGQHLCFIGSGQEEEDRYVNMVVASFLQKYQKYVSIVFGGFDSIHDYVQTKSELKDSFNKYIVDHNEELCKTCCSKSPDAFERFKAHQAAIALSRQQASSSFSSAQSLFATTTSFFKGDKGAVSAFSKLTASSPQAAATAQQLAQSGASMLDKFTTAFVSKSNVFKDRLVGSLNSAPIPMPSGQTSGSANNSRSHVSSQDKLGPRYTGGGSSYNLNDLAKGAASIRQRVGSLLQTFEDEILEEPCQEIQIDQWQKDNKIGALFKCAQIKGSAKYPGFIGLNKTHLWILRDIPHNKGFASIAAKRPLDMIIQITSKRRQPDLIIFRYGYANSGNKSSSNVSPESHSPDVVQKSEEGEKSSLSAKERSAPEEAQAKNEAQAKSEADASDIKPDEADSAKQKGLPTIIASDYLQIPEAFEVIRLIKREIVRIMDENSRKASTSSMGEESSPPPTASKSQADAESGQKVDCLEKEFKDSEQVVEQKMDVEASKQLDKKQDEC